MTRLLPLALALALTGSGGLRPPLANCGDWPHWRGSNRKDVTGAHSGWTGKVRPAAKPAWTAKVGEGASSPIVVGEHVFTLGYSDGKDVLRCLSAKDGKQLWSVSYKCP